MKRWPAVLALLSSLSLGCGPERTEMLVRVFNDGLVVPSDVDSVYFKITDMNGGVRREQTLQLCRPGSLGQGCFSFPITALLIPGDGLPDSDVAIEVDAVNKMSQTVIANAAKFRFTRGTTQHIDFVLYPDCLNQLTCAAMYQVCLKNGLCGEAPKGTLDTDLDPKSNADLSTINVGDMSVSPPDLATPDLSLPDLAMSLDLKSPFDLLLSDLSTRDMTQPKDMTMTTGNDMCTPFCGMNTCVDNGCGTPCLCTSGYSCVSLMCMMMPNDMFSTANDMFSTGVGDLF